MTQSKNDLFLISARSFRHFMPGGGRRVEPMIQICCTAVVGCFFVPHGVSWNICTPWGTPWGIQWGIPSDKPWVTPVDTMTYVHQGVYSIGSHGVSHGRKAPWDIPRGTPWESHERNDPTGPHGVPHGTSRGIKDVSHEIPHGISHEIINPMGGPMGYIPREISWDRLTREMYPWAYPMGIPWGTPSWYGIPRRFSIGGNTP